MKERLNQLFMSKEQTIYLIFLFVESVVYGMFAATFTSNPITIQLSKEILQKMLVKN